MLGAGVLAGVGNLLVLAAAASGQLAIVSGVAANGPAVAVLLARVLLSERWDPAPRRRTAHRRRSGSPAQRRLTADRRASVA